MEWQAWHLLLVWHQLLASLLTWGRGLVLAWEREREWGQMRHHQKLAPMWQSRRWRGPSSSSRKEEEWERVLGREEGIQSWASPTRCLKSPWSLQQQA